MSPRGVAAAILVAAGRGERAGEGPPKQFRDLSGIPVLARAWEPFRACETIGEIVLVLPERAAADPPGWLRDAPGRLVAGGETRTESVARGLEAVSPDVDVVLVHDGVRPFASLELLRRVLEAARRGPVVPLLPLRDTVKEVDDRGRVRRTLERASLRRAQTPQGFPATVLREAHRRAAEA
ncbi:MAG TPA: IspD/TarI family cytidylyltransferase, partial [Gemmatimonadota bacterium]|nr:IspD/TarI family cytidylyltransferase [Gemmatimonadota bacterium]